MTSVLDQPTETTEPAATVQPVNKRIASFSTREAPWMKVGAVIDEPVDSTRAAELGGLNFNVALRPAASWVPESSGEPGGTWKNIPNRRAIVREDTGEVFDVVSNDYQPVQYADAFAFMDEVHPLYVAAGTLRGGKQGFMVVQRPDFHTLDLDLGEHDPHELYAILRTSHDRSRGLEVALMGLRNRCMNQLPLASFTSGAVQRWAIRHAGDVARKMSTAQEVFRNIEVYANSFAETAKQLADIDLLIEDAQNVLRSVLPDRPRREDQVSAIIAAWQESPYVGFRNNGWGLVNGVSEYFEWQRETNIRTSQSRMVSGLDGPTHKMVNRTANLLRLRRGR